MNGWKSYIHDHAIAPVQQFRNTLGKNATDSALIIDAMDILYSHSVRCFCIVSSDSDYTRLATRIREDGITVIGIGKANTPPAFVKAWDVFIRTENLVEDPGETVVSKKPGPTKAAQKPATAIAPPTKVIKTAVKPTAKTQPAEKPGKKQMPKATPAQPKKLPPPVEMLQKAFAMTVQEDGWAHLGAMGSALRQIDPAFDSRTWGFSQLSQLIAATTSHFQMKNTSGPGAGGHYIKKKGQTGEA